MINRQRKYLSIILAVVMLLSMQITFVFADTETAEPIVILHTNDIHSKVDGALGYASVKGWKDYYESRGSAVLVLDAGDNLHGFPVANLSRGGNIVELMNAAGYTAMTPGNHDFNYGAARLIELSKMMSFDLLSANFTDQAGTPVFKACNIYTAGDKKIGIIGISTPETATKTNPLNVQGYLFNEDKIAALVQAEIDGLEAAGADYIVALGHLGLDLESAPYRSTDLIAGVTGLDVFIDGHSHTSLETGQIVKDKAGNDVLLAQTGTQFAAIGKIGVDGDKITASLIKEAKPDDTVQAIITEQLAEIQPQMDQVISKTDIKLDGNRDPGVRTQETNLGDLAMDALKYISGADVALINGGAIRVTVEPGEITYGEINSVFPFGNTVATIEITGDDLLAALRHGTQYAPAASGGFPQVAGMSYEIHTYLDTDRVKNVKINGEPLDLEKTYTLATNDFIKAGGDGYTMLARYPKTADYGALDEALVKYISEEMDGTVDSRYAKPQGRIAVMLTPYTDVVTHWARTSIADVVEQNLFKGISAASFQPNAPMTRGMFVTILGRIDGADVSTYTESKFTDVDMSQYFGGYVGWATENGITGGITADRFGPNEPVTREQMAVLMTNYCKYIGEGPAGMWAIRLDYTDLDKVSAWADEGVMFSTLRSYITGYPDGSFGPKNKATRAEAAVIFSRFLAQQAAEDEVSE